MGTSVGEPSANERRSKKMKGNANARKHGLSTAKAFLSEFGQVAIDGRSALGRALADWKSEVIADLGGFDNLSAQQLALLEVLTRTKVLLDGVDNYILSQRSLVNKRRKSVHPVVVQRTALAESFVKHLTALGLERRAPQVRDLKTYLAEQGGRE